MKLRDWLFFLKSMVEDHGGKGAGETVGGVMKTEILEQGDESLLKKNRLFFQWNASGSSDSLPGELSFMIRCHSP